MNAENPCKVMLVDDDSDNRETMRMLLSAAGYRVACARNGADALPSIDNWQPDVVLLDYVMPTMDGATLARLLRARPGTRDMVIVMTSGLDEDMVRPVCDAYDAYLHKPYSIETALAAIDAALVRKRSAASA
jgi:two-component system phosphate regulon response regulator PhoB